MRFAVRVLLVAGAIAGAAAEVWAVRSGWSWTSAAVDLLAGWSLLAAGGLARHVSPGCRTMLALSGACWFLATPEVVGGQPGHDAALLGAVWVAPFATALLGSPDLVPVRVSQRAVAIALWARAVPVLAAVGWLTAALGGCLAAVALLDVRCYAIRVPRVGAAVIGAVLGAAGLLQAASGRGSALEPLIAVSVASCAVAMLVIRPVPAGTGSGLRRPRGRAWPHEGCAVAGAAAGACYRRPAATAAVSAGARAAVHSRLGTASGSYAPRPGRHSSRRIWSRNSSP